MAATRVRRNIRKGTSSGLRTFPAHFRPYLLTNHPLNEYLRSCADIRVMSMAAQIALPTATTVHKSKPQTPNYYYLSHLQNSWGPGSAQSSDSQG